MSCFELLGNSTSDFNVRFTHGNQNGSIFLRENTQTKIYDTAKKYGCDEYRDFYDEMIHAIGVTESQREISTLSTDIYDIYQAYTELEKALLFPPLTNNPIFVSVEKKSIEFSGRANFVSAFQGIRFYDPVALEFIDIGYDLPNNVNQGVGWMNTDGILVPPRFSQILFTAQDVGYDNDLTLNLNMTLRFSEYKYPTEDYFFCVNDQCALLPNPNNSQQAVVNPGDGISWREEWNMTLPPAETKQPLANNTLPLNILRFLK